MSILIQLLVAVIVFLVAQWLIGLTAIPSPLNLLLALVIAVIAFWQSPSLVKR